MAAMVRTGPILYAHRGASLERPENTLEAIRLAIELGADAVETDAHLTRDGRLVLSHDPDGSHMAGVPRRIVDMTLSELREWNMGAGFVAPDGSRPYTRAPVRIATVEELLAEFPGVYFNIEAKATSPNMAPALVRCVREARAQDRVRLASFSWANLRRIRALGYEGETGMAPPEVARCMIPPLAVARLLPVPGDVAQVPLRAWGIDFATQASIDRLHALGLPVEFWTINDVATAEKLLAMGADAIMTDDPRLFLREVRVFRDRSKRPVA